MVDEEKTTRGPILVTKSSMPPLDEYVSEIAPLWETHWLTNAGPIHQLLSNKLERYLSVENIELFVNGHSALEAAIEASGVRGEAITTPFTFASTTHALVRRGITPVFCDVKQDDFTIDPNKIEALITPRTTAIVPVHVYGHACDVEAIEAIAKKHGLIVIYDAAHAFGERYKDRSLLSYGDISMLSFHATKVFNTIEGGALCFKNAALHPVFKKIRDFGITGPETVESIDGNFKMNEFCAAMGVCNLRHVDDEISKRKRVFDRYYEKLQGIPGVGLMVPQQDVTPNYAYMPVTFDEQKCGSSRDDICFMLAQHGIFARKYFYPLTSDFVCYAGRFDSSQTPIAQWAAKHVLCLPMFADLPHENVDEICSIIYRGCNL